MRREVVFPIVLRGSGRERKILAFRHPLAGTQLVKGGIEPGESPAVAARRELFEESGLTAGTTWPIGTRAANQVGPIWHFFLCEVTEHREGWVHHCLDDGGHDFAFFWHPLSELPGANWHAIFHKALAWLRDV